MFARGVLATAVFAGVLDILPRDRRIFAYGEIFFPRPQKQDVHTDRASAVLVSLQA